MRAALRGERLLARATGHGAGDHRGRPTPLMHAERLGRVRAAMAELDVEVLLLSVGADLPWLIGYEAMPLERLTMLVVRGRRRRPRWSCPGSRRRGWSSGPSSRSVPWAETDDPLDLVAGLAGPAAAVAIGDRTWAQFVLGLQQRMPGARFRRASEVTGPLRAVKDEAEVEALARAGAAVDRIAAALQAGRDPAGGPHRGGGVGRSRAPHPGRGPPPGELRHRRRRRERGQPPPRGRATGSSAATRSCCATSAARC